MEVDCVSFRSRFRWHRTHGSDDGSDAINGRPSHPIIHNPPHFLKGSCARSLPATAAVSFSYFSCCPDRMVHSRVKEKERESDTRCIACTQEPSENNQVSEFKSLRPSDESRRKKDEKGSCLKNEERRLFEVYQASQYSETFSLQTAHSHTHTNAK